MLFSPAPLGRGENHIRPEVEKMKEKRRMLLCDGIGAAVLGITALAACWNMIRYIAMGSLVAFVTTLVVDVLFILVAYTAWKGRMPWLLLIVSAAGGCLFYTTNYNMEQLLQPGLLIQTIVSGMGLLLGMAEVIRKKLSIRGMPYVSGLLAIAIGVSFMLIWKVNVDQARNAQGHARQELWAVPEQYDAPDCGQPGTVEEIVYQTKAYATDSREVEKRALVYLPYGYDESQKYNILYLMHGTGDDENYWLSTNSYNKDMLDRMISEGTIEPLIVVTPTFYTEDDCADDLDQLTYSFKDELRNDLMPAVESRYSTFAESCDEAGFTASRDHRAFAGLSRGAVTACHSALCGSLDYFSWFGLFSAFRTEESYLRQTMQSGEFGEYPIRYLYMTSGNFDFALPGQVPGYELLLGMEPRLTHGVNADFDIFPMRYHSMGCWHLSLYNFLQRIF